MRRIIPASEAVENLFGDEETNKIGKEKEEDNKAAAGR